MSDYADAWDAMPATAKAAVDHADAWDAIKPAPPRPLTTIGKAKPELDLKGEGYKNVENYSGRDAFGGMVRGAGSIGASIIRALPAFAGGDTAQENETRRSAMDSSLKDLGVNPNSGTFAGSKLATEVAGTWGAGGLLSKLLTKIPGAAAQLPHLLPAIESSGMTANGATGAYGVATRAAGGAVTTGAATAAINPEDAKTGAMLGALLPPAVQGASKLGEKLGTTLAGQLADKTKEFNRSTQKNDTIRQSIDAGYVLPPNIVNPSLKNQTIESFSGKQATQQIFSAKNEDVTGGLVRKALGMADDAPLSRGAMEDLRRTAGKPYAEVSNLSPQAAGDLKALKTARSDADGWFSAYNRSARPDDLAKAKEYRELSNSLEEKLQGHAQEAGRPDLIPSLVAARKKIAQTYTVQRALNDADGSINAKVFARLHEKGSPLSDGLETIGRFASAFPTVAKTSAQVGSPAAHNLKSIASLLMGGAGFAAGGPLAIAAGAVPFVAPPIARAMMLRKGAQQGLVKDAPELSGNIKLADMLQNQDMQQILLKSQAGINVSQSR